MYEDLIIGSFLVVIGFLIGFIGSLFRDWRATVKKRRNAQVMILCEIESINADAESLIELHEKEIHDVRKKATPTNIQSYKVMDTDFSMTVYQSIARDLGLLDKETAVSIIKVYVSVNRAHNWKRHNQEHFQKSIANLESAVKEEFDRPSAEQFIKNESESAVYAAENYLRALREITDQAGTLLSANPSKNKP